MRLYKILVLLLILFSAGAVLYASEDFNYYFNEGKNYYLNKDYDSAIDMFKKIEDHKVDSGNVYFNIGNCYFRKQDYGRAMLYYERAKKFIPGDSDLKENIDLIKKFYIKDVVEYKKWWLLEVFDKITDFFSFRFWLYLSMAVYIVFCLNLIVYVHTKSKGNARFKGLLSPFGVFFVVLLLVVGYKYYNDYYIKQGVIIEEKVEARSGPDKEFDVLFKLHTGLKIRIVSQDKVWTKIKLPRGLEGWVKTETVELV
ncbi:tetratricopeptide repeat protein [bacterium]|nr:tetratricopeptide repeat protein [bacterium]